MAMLRCFIAIELPKDFTDAIGCGIMDRLKSADPGVKWVKPANLHITLKFLGPVPEDRVHEIAKSLTTALGGARRFEMAFRGTGAFPDASRARVVWVGVEDAAPLMDLQLHVEAAMVPLGFAPEERKFKAHLTLGRIKPDRGGRSRRPPKALADTINAHADESFGSVAVEGASLMKSELAPSGPIYTRLSFIGLG